jgi:PAS domain S-box-containing protein
MVVIKIIAHTSRLLAALIGITLVSYIGYLVLAQYRTQLVLQEAALKQLASDSARRATAVSYFFSERKDDLRQLEQSREFSAYFENKALGMSMEYGLKASLIMMEDLCGKMHSSKLLAGKPIFERILFIDASGAVLADTQKAGGPGATGSLRRYFTPAADGPTINVLRRNGELKILISTPVLFKGKFAGEVMAWISSSQVYQFFIEGSGEMNRYPVALVFKNSYVNIPERVQGIVGAGNLTLPPDIRPQVPYKLHQTGRSDKDPAGYAILVPVEGSPLSLMTFIPSAEMSDVHSPRRMLYTTGGIAVFILFGMFYFQRINTSNAVLQVHLQETTLREAAVDEKNRLLAAEIEERRQTEMALRGSEARFRAIVGAVPVVIYEFRPHLSRRDFGFVGDKILELAGISAESMVEDAATFFDLIHPADRSAALEASDLAFASGTRFNHEFRIVKPDGKTRWILACSLPPPGARGSDAVWCGCLEDITDRKQADLALRESQQLLRDSEATLRALMDSMPAGVWWFNEAGEVEYLNGRFEELFGYALEEIPKVSDWFRHAYPDPQLRAVQQQKRDDLIAEARRQVTPVPPQETMVACRDGSARHIIVNTQFSEGRTLEIFTDITEQEFIHNELLKVQKMESLGVLAGGIAHDFNNILTGIMGNISFAQLILKDGNDASLPLQAAEKASRRAAELAHQLLTFAKGGQPIKKVVAVANLVNEAVSLSLRGTNVQGKILIPDDLDDIEADAGQMNQAFNNIVINAAHAMSGGGTLTVSGENMSLEVGNRVSLPPGPYIKLVFSDEGCGIPQADQKNIFDPYFTTKSGGNGLGLASTLSIVRKHGGHVLVQSELGKGTRFTFYLPSTKAPPLRLEAAASVAPLRHLGGSVLVMDDEEMLRTLSSQILSHLGYQVTTCAHGEEAIELYISAKERGTPYLAVVMDLTIPGGMGGKEAAQRILAYDPSAKLIVSSGYSNDLALSDYSNYGFCGAVVKPYKVSQLGDTLRALQPPA